MAPSTKHYLLFFTIFISSFDNSLALELLGFTVDLIHRDSLKSTFFNETTMPLGFEIKDDPQADLYPFSGDYLMSYSIGIPRYRTFGAIDTGSGNSVTIFYDVLSHYEIIYVYFTHL